MQSTALKSVDVPFGMTKANYQAPAFVVSGRTEIGFADGISFMSTVGAVALAGPIGFAADLVQAGSDFVVFAYPDGTATAFPLGTEPSIDGGAVIGGFHYAPGGNATGTSGGDDVPAINPYSCWDLNFRPACESAAGMALVDGRFWCDIYLTGCDHPTLGTSSFGDFIADGDDTPKRIDDGVHDRFDFETAKAVLAEHGKQLLGAEEFFAMAYGVTERSAAGTDPQRTGLDAPRTSKWGIMQATGNMWTWGTDGHPDVPRASLFGGSGLNGSSAGSRCADLDCWPGRSGRAVGARGRSDHLIHAD
jgi:hypothetical protein